MSGLEGPTAARAESPASAEFDHAALALWFRRVRYIRYPLTLAFLSAAITFVFGFCTYLVVENKMPPEGWLDIWNRWDAVRYIEVAQQGYGGEASGEHRFMIVFLPLYPLTIYLAHFLITNWHAAAVVVSNLFCAGAFTYCFLLTEKEYGRRAAKVAVFYFSIFPTAYFLHVGYSESIFLFLTIAAFYYARQGRWLACAVLGMLATSSRLTGLAIMLPLVFEYLHQKQLRLRAIRWDCAFLGLIPLGLVAYLYINYHYFGDPLKFLEYQREHWFRTFSSPFPALESNLYMVTHDRAVVERVMQHGSNLVAFAFGTTFLIIGAARLRPCYTIYLALSWVLTFCDSFTLCSPRYLLTFFPIFMLLGHWRRREWLHYSFTLLFLLFYAMNATQFVRGWWAH